MKTVGELVEWISGAREQFEDPSVPVTQVFINFRATSESDLRADYSDREMTLHLGLDDVLLPISDEPVVRDGVVESFGMDRVSDGLWNCVPSLSMPGLIHAFIVLYNVPIPAPWERRIWMPGEAA